MTMSRKALLVHTEVTVAPSYLSETVQLFFCFAVTFTFFYFILVTFIENPIDYEFTDSGEDFDKENKILEVNSQRSVVDNSSNALFQSNKWVDTSSAVYYPWPNETECKNLSTRFAKNNTFKPRALVSFPGSGNSWIRYLIECSTGIFTGTTSPTNVIYDKGLYGEFRMADDGTTIVQKTHYDTIFVNTDDQKEAIEHDEEKFQYRGILIIRNPYKAIFSYWNFKKTNDQLKHITKLNSSDKDWLHHVSFSAEKWAGVITAWVKNSDDLLIVQYEKLKRNPEEVVVQILNYLHIPINSQRMKCLFEKNNVEGPFHREGQARKDEVQVDLLTKTFSHVYESIYPPHLESMINNKIQEVNALFTRKRIPIHLNYTTPKE